MAYFEPSRVFLQGNALAIPAPADFTPAPPEATTFLPTEWTVIALARQDDLATLREAGRWSWGRSKLGRLLLGAPRTYSLSGERLEALRRIAVEAWHRPLAISQRALGGFVAAGFTSAQFALLLATTGALRVMAGQTVRPGGAAA